MSSLAGVEPERAIRNALERLRRIAADSPVEHAVIAECDLIETALVALGVTECLPGETRTHAIDCDLDEDCSCGVGDEDS